MLFKYSLLLVFKYSLLLVFKYSLLLVFSPYSGTVLFSANDNCMFTEKFLTYGTNYNFQRGK